jgi:Flp pilus assembly protein TadD
LKGTLPLLLVLALSACAAASGGLSPGAQALTADDVLRHSPLAEPGFAEIDSVAILELSPAMAAFLDENVDRNGSENERLAQLVLAVVKGDRFSIAYDDSTRSAASTFEIGRGNCLSFTSMFIAMARDLGLQAHYQEVEIPPDWSMSGEFFLLSQHVNAVVDIRNALSRVVDFNTYEFNAYNESRIISDRRALAHYFNNIGAEQMLAGESAPALANLQKALAEDPTFASAWVNLGILHRREGYPAYAEAAYQEALELEKANLLAMSNLASLYEEQGRPDLAENYAVKVRAHRMKNPYYRYELANLAFMEGDYKAAISNLKYATRKRGEEDRFHYLLSLSYLMDGDREASRQSMQRAEELARQGKDRQKYHHKLDLLKALGPVPD